MKVSELYKEASSSLLKKGFINSSLEVRIILQNILDIDHNLFILELNDLVLNSDQLEIFNKYISERLSGKPLAYILQKAYFWNDDFFVNEDVLIPRQDSETIIEALLDLKQDHSQKLNILDIGVGSGCLLLSCLKEYQNAQGVGVDISKNALNVAKYNANNLGLSERSSFILSDIFNNLKPFRYDVIISNPPYIDINDKEVAPDVRSSEPHLALFTKNNGLYFYDEILREVINYLDNDGILIFECGINQAIAIEEIAKKNKFVLVKKYQDLNYINRVLVFKNRVDNL